MSISSPLAHSARPDQRGQSGLARPKSRFWPLTLGCIGVVYGDIGTSPLYALKESLNAARGGQAPTEEMVLGVLSLMIWALVIVVTLKYVLVMLRADNAGEGGTLTLMALAQRSLGGHAWLIPALGIAGASLFYGDAVITPAISVLSAIEGLTLISPSLTPYVLPVSSAVLVGLFVVQSHGTARVASWFGPIVLVWLATLAAGGVASILDVPAVLLALDPRHGAVFLATHGYAGALALGAVFLTVTGAEALYADLGHFGRGPIRFAWLSMVFPALVLNYLGQGALVLGRPAAVESPFFLLYPAAALVPVVILATLATIIASQAVITGAYSISQQAIQLGLLPRLEIRQTSASERGQIYVPSVNWLLLLVVLYLVVTFETSSALASAYGVAVTGTMVVTVLLAFVVIWRDWRWPLWGAGLLMAPFLAVDLVFLGANLLKVAEGGWLPLAIGAGLMVVMYTWRRGTGLLAEATRRDDLVLAGFVASLERRAPHRVKGSAVFLTATPASVPTALLHNLKHNHIVHEQNIVVSIETAASPRVPAEERGAVERLSETFWVARLRFGYMEAPDVPAGLASLRAPGLDLEPARTSYFLSRRSLKPSARSRMPRWQDLLFVGLSRVASDAAQYFRIPTNRLIEVGTQIVI